MPSEGETKKLEEKANQSHLGQKDEDAASQWQQAGTQREELGDDAARAAARWDNPPAPQQPKPEVARSRRCDAARHWAQAADDYLEAALLCERLAERAADPIRRAMKTAEAVALRQKAKDAATKALQWLEGCLDAKFESGDFSEEVSHGYVRLAIYLDLIDKEDDALKAFDKSLLVEKFRKKAAEEAKKALENK